jgi:hypothetical protein
LGFHAEAVSENNSTAELATGGRGRKEDRPIMFEVPHADFTPKRDLDILILYRPRP